MTDEIKKTLNYLCDPNQIIEIRIPKLITNTGFRKNNSGYFKDIANLAQEVYRVDSNNTCEAIYFSLNTIDEECYARSAERLDRIDNTTSDKEITARRWLFIDVDARRPKGTSSTNVQHELALAKIQEIADYLTIQGWPKPVFADSGNGGHLLYRIDLPPDDDHIIEKLLKILAAQFNQDRIELDTSVYNPARICKLYGTYAKKGSSTDTQPHRQSKILWDKSPSKSELDIVPIELLNKLVDMVIPVEEKIIPKESIQKDGRFKLESWMIRNVDKLGVINTEPTKFTKDGAEVWALKNCPFHSDHVRSAYIYRYPSGGLTFGCFGNRCTDKDWFSLRELIEPEYMRKNSPKKEGEAESGKFFLDVKLNSYIYVDLDEEQSVTYTNKGDWQNKYKLINDRREMPDPYEEIESIYNPKKPFGFYENENGRTVFNRFKPSEYWFKEYPDDYRPRPTPVFDALYANAFGGSDHVFKLLAYMLQNKERFRLIPVIINEEGGSGKGQFENHIIRPILGEGNCSLNLGQEDLSSAFNDYLVDKLYIGFHETNDDTEYGMGSKVMRKIKRMFDDTITVEVKYIPRVSIPNHASCFIYSNSPNPITIPVHDRRALVLRSNDKRLETLNLFKQTEDDTENDIDTFQQSFAELHAELPDVVFNLYNCQIEPGYGKININTAAKYDLQDRSKGPIDVFIEALYNQDEMTLGEIAKSYDCEFSSSLFIITNDQINTSGLREIVRKVFGGRYRYEYVRKLMPAVEDRKDSHGYNFWDLSKPNPKAISQ